MKRMISLILFVFIYTNVTSQIVSNNAFLKGNYVEVGVSQCGSYGTSVGAPSGYHPRSNYGTQLGFVADPAKDGWTVGYPNYVGGYFLPGSPEEGWGLTVNGTNYNNNRICGINNIPGSIISYTNTTSEVSATWQGTVAGLSITSRTYIPKNSVYFVTEVTIVNTSASTINNVYYMRNVDPDHGVKTPGAGGSYTTQNSVVYQNPNSCNRALATAITLSGNHYLGLGSLDSRARVTHGGFSNRSALNIWNGTGLYTSGSRTADQAISISFNLGNLAANQTTTFAYAYILSAADLTTALASTNTSFDVNAVSYTSSSSASVCSGVAIPITLSNTGTYTSWSWLPATGLNTTSGTSVIATIASPTTYTATGTGACGSVSINITLNPTTGLPVSCAGPITGPTTISLGQTGNTFSITPVTNATSYAWVLPPGSIVTSGANSNSITFNASNISWCGNITVTPSNTCNTGCSSSYAVCLGNILTTGTISSPLCVGQVISIPFTAVGIFNAGNTYSAQLSNASGSFASPVTIGSLLSNAGSGNISAIIPALTPAGTAYRIRVVSDNLSGIGSDNGSDIIINIIETWYLDSDNDNYYIGTGITQCGSPGIGYKSTALLGVDCNDNNASIYPGAVEITCNGIDENCNGMLDDDPIPPTITCPSNININATSASGALVNYTAPIGTDNCSGATTALIAGFASGSTFPIGTTTVTYEVTDASNITAQCSFTITVNGAAPNIVCPANISVNNDAGVCGATVNFAATETTGIPASTITYSHVQGSLFPIGNTSVTATATNAVGTSSCTFTVAVADNEAPVFTSVPLNTTANTDAGQCGAYVPWSTITASDNCTISSITNDAPPGQFFPIGTTTVTVIATDPSVNSSTTTFDVTVVDSEAPTISCPSNINATATSAAGAIVNYTAPVGTDNCSGSTTAMIAGLASGSTFPIGTTTVTYEVTDAANLTAQCSFTITVAGVTPSIVCPANITVNNDAGVCGAIVNFAVTETTAIPASTITYSHTHGSFFTVGTTIVTATATNAIGTSSCTFEVIVIDNEIPSINCPSNISVIATSASGAIVNYTTPVGSDNCSGATTAMIAGLASGSTFPIGTTTVTYEVTDAANNTAQCLFTVTVVGVAPVIVCPSNITVNNDAGVCGANVSFAATETTGIPASTITYSHTPGSYFPVGTTVVTATATNAVGTSSCNFEVIVIDNELPIISCPSNISTNNNAGICGAAVTYTVTSSDNCTGQTVSQTTGLTSGSIFPIGTTTNTFVVTDASNNTAICSFYITITDNEVPIVITQNVGIYLNATGQASITTSMIDNGSNDNCGIASMTLNKMNFVCSDVGANTVTLTVTDNNSNVSTSTATVTVQDNVAPVAIAQDVTVQLDATGNGSTTATAVDNASTDACGIASLVLSKTAFTCADIATNPNSVTLTVTDNNGNVSTATANVIVEDNIFPTLSCAVNTVRCANIPATDSYQVVGTEFDLTAMADNCSIISVTNDQNGLSSLAGVVFVTGSTQVTWTVIDASNNVSTCSFTVIVNPLPVPTITASTADDFCNGVTLTSTSSTSENLYLWSTNDATQSVFLTISQHSAGMYYVTVTDLNGCISNLPAAYNYQPENLNSSYTIIGFEQVKIGERNYVQSGSVGLTNVGKKAEIKKYAEVNSPGSFVKADYIQIHNNAVVLNAIYDPAVITLPTMNYFSATGISGNINVNKNTTTTINATHKDIKIKENCNVTITGSTYGKIEIDKGCVVTFTSSSLDIEGIKIKKSKKSSQATSIKFTGDAVVRVKEKIEVEEFCNFNPNAYKVICYIGESSGKKAKKGELKVNAKGVSFNSSVYIPNGEIHVHKDAKSSDPGYMTGMFIAKKVHAHGKYVYWNWHNCGNPNGSKGNPMPENTTSIEEANNSSFMNVYPNPATDNITVEFGSTKSKTTYIEMYNLVGERLNQIKLDNTHLQVNKLSVDMSTLPVGIYMIKVISGEEMHTQKVILTK